MSCTLFEAFVAEHGRLPFSSNVDEDEMRLARFWNVQQSLLKKGMVIAVEPMLNLGKRGVFVDADDEWTVYTEDGSLSAQWEHTLLVTEDGVEIISK